LHRVSWSAMALTQMKTFMLSWLLLEAVQRQGFNKVGEACGPCFSETGNCGTCAPGLKCSCVGACANPMIADAPSTCVQDVNGTDPHVCNPYQPCMNQDNARKCRKMYAICSDNIQIMESCPLQFGCPKDPKVRLWTEESTDRGFKFILAISVDWYWVLCNANPKWRPLRCIFNVSAYEVLWSRVFVHKEVARCTAMDNSQD